MRVLIAPDRIGPLGAGAAAAALAAGWARQAPADEVAAVPVSGPGVGLLDALHAARGGRLLAVTVRGARGGGAPGAVLLVGTTGYVEAAQVLHPGLRGRPLVAEVLDPERLTSRGVGELVRAAVQAGAREVVVGVGESVVNDGGAGVLAGLGAVAEPDGALDGGAAALALLASVDLGPARELLRGVRLVLATDTTGPLYGLRGAASVDGRARGIAPDRLLAVDAVLERFAAAADPGAASLPARDRAAEARGAGAGGGVGFALLVLGGERVEGVATVLEATGLARRARAADLVLTGLGTFDWTALRGGVVPAVAATALAAARPCVLVCLDSSVGLREMRANGIDAAYSVTDALGRSALDRPAQALGDLAARVARTWSRG